MLCAKYDYKMDIAVKQEEAFENGMEKGMQQKAIEAAITLVKEYSIAPEDAAAKIGAPLDKVLEVLSEDGSEVNALYDKYGYNLEIAAKQKEAFENGMEQRAVEDAITLVKEFNIAPELAAEKIGAPLDKVLEKLGSGNAGR